jgi:hypothetical protein
VIDVLMYVIAAVAVAAVLLSLHGVEWERFSWERPRTWDLEVVLACWLCNNLESVARFPAASQNQEISSLANLPCKTCKRPRTIRIERRDG